MSYILTLKGAKEIAHKTVAFWFEKPRGFVFSPGQSMRFQLPASGESRTFSIVSAPHENELIFAMRIRGSKFKKLLASLPRGAHIKADGPFGERFILHKDAGRPAVFIAGGIGITPLLSMLSSITKEKLPYNITLFYPNRRKEDIAFRDALKKLEQENSNLKIVLTLTKDFSQDKSWDGERGYINKEMLLRYISVITTPFFYVAGPPLMVSGMKDTLEKAGVPSENILTKKFSGYV